MDDLSFRRFSERPDAIANRLMQKAHNRDGLPEIAIGLSFLFLASLIYVQTQLERGSNRDKMVSLALCSLIPLMGFGAPWAVKRVRRQFLIESVGYVQPKPIGVKLVAVTLVIAVAAAVLVSVISHAQFDGLILACSGVFGGGLAVLSGRSLRFAIGGILVAAAGVLIGLSGTSLEIGFVLLWGFAGILSLLSGCIVLLHFLRQPAGPGE